MRRALIALSIVCVAALGLGRAYAAQHEAPHAGAHDGPESAEPGAPVHPEHGTEHGESGHEGHALKPINWADFSNTDTKPYAIMLLNFGLLIALYYSLGKKPIAAALVQRRASVAKEIEEAQRMKAEAEARAKQYQAKLASLGEELETTRRALVEAGKGERDRIVKEAEEKAERMTKDAVFLLEQEVKQMRQDLVKETVEIAIAVAEEMLKKKITPSDHERLADEYLSELIAKTPRSLAPPRAGGAA